MMMASNDDHVPGNVIHGIGSSFSSQFKRLHVAVKVSLDNTGRVRGREEDNLVDHLQDHLFGRGEKGEWGKIERGREDGEKKDVIIHFSGSPLFPVLITFPLHSLLLILNKKITFHQQTFLRLSSSFSLPFSFLIIHSLSLFYSIRLLISLPFSHRDGSSASLSPLSLRRRWSTRSSGTFSLHSATNHLPRSPIKNTTLSLSLLRFLSS